MTPQTFVLKNSSVFDLGFYQGFGNLENQLRLSRVIPDLEISHFLSWANYTTTKKIIIELFEINLEISSQDLMILLAKKGYRPAVLQELLLLAEKVSYRNLPKAIVIPGLNWSRVKNERKYMVLRRDRGLWRLRAIYYLAKIKPSWRVACVRIWNS